MGEGPHARGAGGGPDGVNFFVNICRTLPPVTRAATENVTHSDVTYGNFGGMAIEDDLAWTRLTRAWERLAWARLRRAEFPTQQAFADAVGMKRGAYRLYEQDPARGKASALSADKAIEFARRLRVRWQWLLLGEGAPWPEDEAGRKWSPSTQRVAEMIESASEADQERIAAVVEAMLRTGTGG